jgi:gliding motility-associated-like protein/uncharacterized repeat protein (TIGR01451 family)
MILSLKNFGMKKFISKVFTVAALTLVMMAGAGGSTAVAAYTANKDTATVNGVTYKIKFEKTSDCWYDDSYITRSNKDNKTIIHLELLPGNNATSVAATKDTVFIKVNAALIEIKSITNSTNFPATVAGNDSAFAVFFGGTVSSTSSKIFAIEAELKQPDVSDTVWATVRDTTIIAVLGTVYKASVPSITQPILMGDSMLFMKGIDTIVPTIVVLDTTKQLKYYFAGEGGSVKGFKEDSIGWKKADLAGDPSEEPPTLPSPGDFFQASDDSLEFMYTYKYIAGACELDTSIYVGVWIQKGYSPVLANRIQDRPAANKYKEVDAAGSSASCTRVYQIVPPYIAEMLAIAHGSKPIDTIQVDTVWRIVVKKGAASYRRYLTIGGSVAYSYQWGNAADTVHLDEGNEYTVKYRFHYRYANKDSVATDTVQIIVPYSIRTNPDTAGYDTVGMLQNQLHTGDTARIDVMLNDSISSCLTLDSMVLKVYTYAGGTYGTTGASRRGGTVIADSITENGEKKKIVKYIPPRSYQGLDTFIYQIADTSVYGKLGKNVKQDTVLVRVLPRYELAVTKRVDSVANRKFRRGQGDPNLDSMFVGDTAYFSVRVKNIGKNSIADSITVRDTLPAGFDTVELLTATPAQPVAEQTPQGRKILQWKFTGSDAEQDMLSVDSVRTITYRLVALKFGGHNADTNRVHVAVRLPKNAFEAPNPGDTATVAHSDTVLLSVYQSVDVAFSQKMDTSGVPVDTLTCDSLYQEVKFVLTAKNVGSSPLSSIKISDTLSAGMRLVKAEYYLIGKNDTTPISAGIAMAKTRSGSDTVYTWTSTVRVGPDSALQVVLTAAVDSVGTFRSTGYAFESGGIDIDSADNYEDIASVVIFKPDIKLEVKKEWGKYFTSTGNVTHSVLDPYIGKGNTLQLTIAVSNRSALPLHNVVVRDTLNTAYLQRREDGIHSSSPTSTSSLTWAADSSSFVGKIKYLGIGESDTLYFYVRAKDTTDYTGRGTPLVISDDSVGNVAYAYLPSYYGYDSVYCDSISKFLIQPGLDLTLRASVMTYRIIGADTLYQQQQQGDTVRLRLVAENTSEDEDVEDTVKVKVIFSHDSLTYSSDAPTPNSSYNPQDSTWTIPPDKLLKVTPGSSSSDSITITLIALKDTGRVTLGGYIAGSPDVNTKNNASYDTLRIVENPVDLRVTKKVTATVYLAQDPPLVYDSITISTYKRAISGITLVDLLPLGIVRGSVEIKGPEALKNVLKVDSTGQGRYFVATKSGNFISLGGSTDTTVVISYKLSEEGEHVGVAAVFCDSLEATRDNNRDSATTKVLPMVNLKVTPRAAARHPDLVTGNNDLVIEGDTIAYTLVVEHDTNSNSGAEGVTLIFDTIGANCPIVFIPTGSSESSIDSLGRIVFNKVDVDQENTYSVVVLARVKPNATDVLIDDTIRWRAWLSCESDIWRDNDTAYYKMVAVNNPNDVSVSITPRDTVFYYSEARGNRRTPTFTDTIKVKNSGEANLANVIVEYSFDESKMEYNGRSSTEPDESEARPSGSSIRVLTWKIGALEKDSAVNIIISGCNFPYQVAGYSATAKVFIPSVLESDPTNNADTATARVIYDVDLKIDNIQLLNSHSKVSQRYTQGDTVSVCVKLTNKSGKKDGSNVSVRITNTSGFTAIDSSPHRLQDTLKHGGALYDTLRFVIDTFTTAAPLCLYVAASAETPGSSAVAHSAASDTFTVSKGADAAVWLDAVEHKRVYYSNLSYTIAVADSGSYRATDVRLYHAVPDSFRTDSVRIQNSSGDTTLISPVADSVWSLGTIGRQDIARITFYVTSTSTADSATLPIEGYIACVNDYNVRNDTIINALKYTDKLIITSNPYHLKVSKAASHKSYGSITDTITYTIVVKNVGDSAAYQLRIADTLPRTVTYQSLLDTGKTDTAYFDAASAVVVWEIDSLKPDSSCTLTVKALPYEAGPVVNTAMLVKVDSTQQHPFDPDDENKKSYTGVDTTKVLSDQRITLATFTAKWSGRGWDTTDAFAQGDTLRLTLVVEKVNKNEKALGVKITPDTASLGGKLIFFAYENDTAGNHQLGSTFSGATKVWTLNLDTSSSARGVLTLYAVVAPNFTKEQEGKLELLIRVADTSEYYPKIEQDTVKEITLQYCEFDLAVKVEVEPTEDLPANRRAVYPATPFTYNIAISNLRDKLPDDATVTLVDTLPAGISVGGIIVDGLVPYDISYPLADGRTVLRWSNLRPNLGNIENGGSMRLQLANCKASAFGYYPNKAQIFVNRHEADLRNNSSADTVWVVNPIDLSLRFEAADTVMLQGKSQDLTLIVTSRTKKQLTDLRIATEPIPKQLSFVENKKYYSSETRRFTWDNDENAKLPFGDSLTKKLTVQAADTGAVAWRAVLYAGDDSVATDTVKLYVKKNPYNVKLTKTTSKAVFYKDAQPPYSFTYTISVSPGDSAIANVVVRDTLPAGVDTAAGFAAKYPAIAVERVDGNKLAIALDTIELLQSPLSDSFGCVIDTNLAAAYLNRAYASCDGDVFEASLDDNTDTALVEVRNVVNLKVSVALCDGAGKKYADDHKFRQGDEFYVKVSVENNGKRTSDTVKVKMSGNVSDISGKDTSFSFIYSGNNAKTFRYKAISNDCGEFSVGALATTIYNSDTATDSAGVTFNVLSGADVKIGLAAAPPATRHSTSRAYTISLKNKGQYKAATVVLLHPLDSAIVRLDSISRKLCSSGPCRETMLRNRGEAVDTALSSQGQEALTYAADTLTYSIGAVGVGDSIVVKLFVTTTEPRGEDTTLQIEPYAEVEVQDGCEDMRPSNNSGFIDQPIVVHPNPYNVSVSITPDSSDRRYPEESEETYTITARNIGKSPASASVYYKALGDEQVIKDPAGDNATTREWIIPQLLKGEDTSFTVVVAATPKSKEKSLNILESSVRIVPIFRYDTAGKPIRGLETDLANNYDTAHLYLYSYFELKNWVLMKAFSPNGDGVNEKFIIHDLVDNIRVLRAEIVIVNRYGNEVYYHRNYKEAQNSESEAFTGAGLPEGTYFYQLTVYWGQNGETEKTEKRGGAITLRRSRW